MPDSSDTPVIGICAVMDQARWSVWDLPAALVPMNYVEAVQRAGGLALLVPPDPALLEDPAALLDRIDGLMLIGGPDVGAGRYGAEPHPLAEPEALLRDGVEIALARAATERGLPLLGVCRGMQLINVAAGGPCASTSPTSSATSGTAAPWGPSPATTTASNSTRARGPGPAPARARTGWSRTTTRRSHASATGCG